MTWKETMILFILAALNFTHVLDFMIMMPLGNFLMPHFHITARFFSWIVAAYPVTACISGLISAFYVDQYDRKKVLLFAYSGFLIGTFCCGIAPDEIFLFAARILTGFFGGMIAAQVFSIVADIFVYEKRGRAMGAIFMAFSIASVFGVPISLYIANQISWHGPFIFIALLGLPVMFLIVRFLPPMQTHLVAPETAGRFRPDIGKVLGDIIANRSQMIALLFSGMLMLGHFLIIPFINPYMEFNLGFSKTETPMLYMVGGVCAFISSSILGRMSDKYGKFRIFSICLILSLIPIYFITTMGRIPLVDRAGHIRALVYVFNRQKYSGAGDDHHSSGARTAWSVHELQFFLSAIVYGSGFRHFRSDRNRGGRWEDTSFRLGGVSEYGYRL